MTFGRGDLSEREIAQDLIEERLAAGGTFRFHVPSDSMAPLLKPGDLIQVRRVKVDELRIGDIVVAPVNGTWRAHRLIARGELGPAHILTTKGDNTPLADPEWRETPIVGVATDLFRGGRRKPLRSRIRRWAGVVAGVLSQWEWRAHRSGRGRPARIVVSGLDLLIHLIDRT